MLPCLRGFRLLAAAEPKLAQAQAEALLRLASVLQDASHVAREGSVKGQRTAPRDLPSPTLPKLSGLLRWLDGLRGRRHDGSALRDRHGFRPGGVKRRCNPL